MANYTNHQTFTMQVEKHQNEFSYSKIAATLQISIDYLFTLDEIDNSYKTIVKLDPWPFKTIYYSIF